MYGKHVKSLVCGSYSFWVISNQNLLNFDFRGVCDIEKLIYDIFIGCGWYTGSGAPMKKVSWESEQKNWNNNNKNNRENNKNLPLGKFLIRIIPKTIRIYLR